MFDERGYGMQRLSRSEGRSPRRLCAHVNGQAVANEGMKNDMHIQYTITYKANMPQSRTFSPLLHLSHSSKLPKPPIFDIFDTFLLASSRTLSVSRIPILRAASVELARARFQVERFTALAVWEWRPRTSLAISFTAYRRFGLRHRSGTRDC